MIVFAALMVLTIATVGAAYLPNVPKPAAITLALFIAGTKGTLVAAYFMHLISEKKLIYFVLGLTSLFFVALIVLSVTNDLNLIGF